MRGHRVRAEPPGGRPRGQPGRGGAELRPRAQYFTSREDRFAPAVASWRERGLVREWEGRLVRIASDGRLEEARPARRLVGCPDMRAIARHLARRLDVRWETPVAHMARGDASWELRGDGGSTLGRYPLVALATPPPQSSGLFAEVPGMAHPAERARFEPCWAVLLEFSERVRVPFDGAFVRSGPLSWAAREGSKPGRPPGERWVLHASGAWSRRRIREAPGRVWPPLLEAFRELARGVPAPTYAAAHCWPWAIPVNPLELECLADAALGVVACGDWCRGPRVEAAWLSGVAAADRLLDDDAASAEPDGSLGPRTAPAGEGAGEDAEQTELF